MDADTANLVEVDNFLLSEKGKKKINIGPIGLNCIVSQSLFSDKIIKKERLGREKLRGGWLRDDDQRSVTGFWGKNTFNAWWQSCSRRRVFKEAYALRVRLNFRSLRRASACLRRFIMLGFS